jgi:hypothetical protein
MMRSSALTVIASLACIAAAGEAQQRGKTEPTERSGLARRVNLNANFNVSAADKAYAMARLDEIERIVLKAVPEMGRLEYRTFADFTGFSASAPKPNTILEYRYSLTADLGARGLCEIFSVHINEAPRGAPDEVLVENVMGKPVPGATVTWSEFVPPPDPSWQQVIFVRDGEAPYRQLTREEVRRWQIVEEEGANGEKLAAKKTRLAITPYQRFMAEAPERKKNRDELRVALKGLRTPAEIAALIKEMEDSEREAAANLKAQEANDRTENDSLSRSQSIADKARASIARMSPAERALPAYVKGEGSDTLYNFGAADASHVARMVRANRGFWSMHKSRVEARSINVGFAAACPKEPPPPEVHQALWKLRQNIDWAALKRMVNEP